jgi:hypothetical protein
MDNNITLYCLDDLLYEQIINNSDFKDKHKDIAKLYKSIQNSNVYTISSIQISSAISSYARIKMINEMYEHKIKNKATIFYYDTDSIFTNKLLPEHKVDSKKIGLFKLEKTYKKALFIAPKVYCLLERNNNEIIKFKSLNQKNLLLTYNYLKKYLIKDTVLEVKNVNIPIKKNIKDLKIYNLNYNYIYDFNSSKYQKIYVNNYFYKTIPIYIKKSYWD